MDEFSEVYGDAEGFVMSPVGWEVVSPGTGRPQDLINDHVRGADYLVALLWDRWGTTTSAESRYSSGTYEELAVALECLSDPDAEMRDLAVFFKGVGDRQLSDAGPQLAQVLQFKNALESRKELFFGTFDTREELRRHLLRLFMRWLRGFGEKVPRMVSLPVLGDGSLEVQASMAASTESSDLLGRADELARRGLVTQAEVAYATAVSTDDRESLISYAKFLRRTGRLERAFTINKRILGLRETLVEVPLASSAADRSYVLANMGVIRRKQGDLTSSRDLLNEAVRTVDMFPDSSAAESKAYALDNLGLTLRRLGNHATALSSHKQALNLRHQTGDEPGQAKTLLNIARLFKDQDQLEDARISASQALEMLMDTDNEKHTLANAYSTLGDITRAEGDLPKAYAHYEKALDLNETIGHTDGVAVVSCQLASLLLDDNDATGALPYAERSLEENLRSGNKEGEAIALRVLGDVQMARGCFGDARTYYQDSFRMFQEHQNQTGALLARIGVAEALAGEGKTRDAACVAEALQELATEDRLSDEDMARIRRLHCG
ncbi:MAG: tetratricopeptide repeat protein [bacterium]|nr:tetratricopeptide repeat protein [bacterium]